MKLEIKDIVDRHKNKKCLVIGHGKSLNPYLDKLPELKNKGYVIIGCNNWNEFYPKVIPDYWVNANTVDNVTNQMPLINTYKPVWVYADSVDLKDKNWVGSNIKTDYLPFDQRHFNKQQCHVCDTFGCKKNLEDRLTIQEELQEYTRYNKHYGTAETVILHSMAFAVIMGCKEIYLLGVDLDYKVGYANNTTDRKQPETYLFDKHKESILNDIQIVSDSVALIDTKIYNTNLNSQWDIFERRSL